ncbi:MAG: putative glycoside hydrolase [Candidatus Magasanikbacteria bacterium]
MLVWYSGSSTSEYQNTMYAYAAETNSSSAQNDPEVIAKQRREKPARQTVKGLYVTAYSAGSEKKIDEIIRLIDTTELNAVVIDIKDYSGRVLYDSDLAMVQDIGAEDNRIGDAKALIKKLHEHTIYVIARQTVFQDPVLAGAKPEWAVKSKRGGIWRDRNGLSWVDPTQTSVWSYNVAIAKEAIRLGFDEINFDYVRFPSDGNMSDVVYTVPEKAKHEVMKEFYHFLNTELTPRPALISLDLFGMIMDTVPTGSDMNIGQRLVDSVDEVDYICPMMYPSHYAHGYAGYENPAQYPSQVLAYSTKKGIDAFIDKRAEFRPWIQAFNIGAVYDAQKIRAQIDTIEKYTDAGWLLWNAANRYTSDGLKSGLEF